VTLLGTPDDLMLADDFLGGYLGGPDDFWGCASARNVLSTLLDAEPSDLGTAERDILHR